jgi:epoxyqueuosine reductase
MNELSEELKGRLFSGGASLVGFADLSEIDSDSRGGFPHGVSIAVALNPQVMSEIGEGPTRRYYDEYERVNVLLDKLGQSAEDYLRVKGYGAVARPTTFHADSMALAARLAHKTVATRAGLGWVGKCALLITEKFGSAVRLTTVLTDARLPAGKPVDESKCGDCTACVDICPAHAVVGKNWRAGMSRESLYDAFACQATAFSLSVKGFGIRITLCGRCIVACPRTKKYLQKYK